MWFAVLAAILVAAPPADDKPTTREQLAQHLRAMVKESHAPAEQALKQLRKLATKENFQSLGFESLEELASAELGHSFPVLTVQLNELREFKSKEDPYRLLHLIPRVVYGVNVKGQVRCGVEVQKRDGKWEVSAIGSAGPARQYAEALKKQAEKDQAREFFIIKVLALFETYLAYQSDQGLRMVEVRNEAGSLEKVETRPAAEVFLGLVKRAKEVDGAPR
jgi:hypothetical protein